MVKSLNKKGGFTSDSHTMKPNVNSLVVKAPTISTPYVFNPPVSEEHSSSALTVANLEKQLSLKYLPIMKTHKGGKRNMKGGNLFVSDYASVNEEVGNVNPNNDWEPKIGESAAPLGNSNINNGDWGSAKHENGIYTPGSDWAFSLGENPAIATQMGAGKKSNRKPKKSNVKKGGNSVLGDIAKVSGNIVTPPTEWAKSVGENVYPPFEEFNNLSKGGAKDKKKPKTVKPKTVKPKTVKPKTVKPKTVKPKTVKPKTVKPKTVKAKTVKPKTVKKKSVKKD